MNAKYLIYGLIDPRDGLIHYVGKSSTGMHRPRQHMRERDAHGRECHTWVLGLTSEGLSYNVVALDVVPDPKAPGRSCWWWTGANASALNDAERWWIAFGRACGWPLTNRTDGGDGSHGYVMPEDARARFRGENNPSKRPEVRAKMRISQSRPELSAHRSRLATAQRPSSHPNFLATMRGNTNPAKRPEVRAKISAAKRTRDAARSAA